MFFYGSNARTFIIAFSWLDQLWLVLLFGLIKYKNINISFALFNTPTTGSSVSRTGGSVSREVPLQQSSALHMDMIKLEIGYELLPLVEQSHHLKITDQRGFSLRKQLAKEMGFIVPSVRVQDNMQIDSNMRILKIKEIEAGLGYVQWNQLVVSMRILEKTLKSQFSAW